ncbi:MAG: hypothetical protein AB1489_04260 [Acidobacteriota bacterium]
MAMSWRTKKEPSITYNPGEFEVLKTKAERAWWNGGTLLITNHRLFWFPTSTKGAPAVEIDLRQVLGCVEVRSWYYFLMRPALKILISNGTSIDFHGISNFTAAKVNIERLMGQDRYTPGALFSNS